MIEIFMTGTYEKFKGYFQTLLKDKNAFQVIIFDRPEQRD